MWYKIAIDTEFWNKDKSNDPKTLEGLFMGVITDSKTRTKDVSKIKTNLEQEKRKVIEEDKYPKEDIESAFNKAMDSLKEVEDKQPEKFIILLAVVSTLHLDQEKSQLQELLLITKE